ncbi:uncharacterized protein LOC109609701 isoform X2 [Aethina tumida]|uniref:uncharacterized protein LOC109609701 isoform X2 n=1 Tax=Aethina tumida TaxID=116153 RepID=UPI002147805C|nr:uncharacterized protein LOC109609701 isoform X2 [Aethina tumida]
MRTWGALTYLFFVVLSISEAQLPPRLQIPGALLVSSGPSPQRPPSAFRQARLLDLPTSGPSPPRLRRPPPNAVPLPVAKEIRPVVEEPEEPVHHAQISSFDDEVNKLVLQSAVREAVSAEEEPEPNPVQFRPQRPVPILRENIRDSAPAPPRPVARPAPVLRAEQVARPAPVLRAEPQQVSRGPIFRGEVPQRQVKQQPLPEYREPPQPVRQPVRQPQRTVEQFRGNPRPRPSGDEDEEYNRRRKPVVQILRKYRTDNPDGSITWGFENEDGTFKEETLGVDCVTRGKYGYVDPDGVKREYTYETGIKCDEQPLEEEEEELRPQLQQAKFAPQPRKPQPQFRPQIGLQ